MIIEEKDEFLERKKLIQKNHYLKNRDEILKRKKENSNLRKAIKNNLSVVSKKVKENLQKPTSIKTKSKSEIMVVLRKFPKSSLWNKEIEIWSELNWIEFNKLKNS